MEEKTKRKGPRMSYQFWNISTLEESDSVIKDTSYVFIFVGLVDIFLGMIAGIPSIADGVIYLILGAILLVKKSRIAAVLLMLMSLASLIATTATFIGVKKGVGTNMLLAIIMFYSGIASTYASFKRNEIRNGKNAMQKKQMPEHAE